VPNRPGSDSGSSTALTHTVTFGLLRSVIPQGKSIAPRRSAQRRRAAAPPDRLIAYGPARFPDRAPRHRPRCPRPHWCRI